MTAFSFHHHDGDAPRDFKRARNPLNWHARRWNDSHSWISAARYPTRRPNRYTRRRRAARMLKCAPCPAPPWNFRMSVPAAKLDVDYTLEHKYTRAEGRIYLSGVQALVRLPLMQQMRDRAAGLNTAGFISGYRGSPLGGFDLELWKAKKHLKASS